MKGSCSKTKQVPHTESHTHNVPPSHSNITDSTGYIRMGMHAIQINC